MRSLDELRAPSDSLWSPMSLSQKFQVMEFIGGQLKRTVRALMRHAAPPCMRDHHYYQPYSLLKHITQSFLFLEEASCFSFLAIRRRYELVPGCT
jgi:hypothetical protein